MKSFIVQISFPSDMCLPWVFLFLKLGINVKFYHVWLCVTYMMNYILCILWLIKGDELLFKLSLYWTILHSWNSPCLVIICHSFKLLLHSIFYCWDFLKESIFIRNIDRLCMHLCLMPFLLDLSIRLRSLHKMIFQCFLCLGIVIR